jgi:hypothetical protein
VKVKVARLSPADKISVVRIQAEEEFGNFVSRTENDFTFYDVDEKHHVTLRYEDVKKVKEGYGGYNIRGRHTDATRNRIILIAGVGVLLGLVIALAATDK